MITKYLEAKESFEVERRGLRYSVGALITLYDYVPTEVVWSLKYSLAGTIRLQVVQYAAIRFPADTAPKRRPPSLQTDFSELHPVHWIIHDSDEAWIRLNQLAGRTNFAIFWAADMVFILIRTSRNRHEQLG